MNTGRLEIQQTHMKLDWDVQRPTYSFEPTRTTVTMEQKPAEMVLHRTPIKLTIDQSQCWADMGIKHVFQRISEEAVEGTQAVLDYIGRVVAEGEQLGAIENKGNVMRQIAIDRASVQPFQFQYGNVPGNFSLHFSVTPGELNMDWKWGETTVDVHSVPFRHTYERGTITYSIQRRNEMHFQVVGGNVDIGY